MHPTPRQTEVLVLAAAGYSYREIGDHMMPRIAEQTVKNHARDAFVRMGARNVTHAVALLLSARPALAAGTRTLSYPVAGSRAGTEA